MPTEAGGETTPLTDGCERMIEGRGRAALLVAAASVLCAGDFPPAHLHHIHLNATDPAAAIDFYTTKFDCEKAKFAGEWDGVWAQKAWILFNKVAGPPPSAITSSIW